MRSERPVVQGNVGLFGTATRTNVLLVISMLGETHGGELARILEISLNQAQGAISSLERAGIIVGIQEGTAKRVTLNPRSPLREELKSLLEKMAMYDVPLQERLGELRRRPRRAGKPL